MAVINFSQLIDVYRAMDFEPGTMEGRLQLSSQEQVELLQKLLADDVADQAGIGIAEGDPDSIAVGDVVRLRLQQPRLGLGLLLADTSSLVAASHIDEPKRYFIVAQKFAKDDVEVPRDVVLYRHVLRLVALLKDAAAYLDVASEELIYIHGGRYAVPVRYGIEDIRQIEPDTVESLAAKFQEDAHREQKLAIMAGSVFDVTSMLKPAERFRALLAGLPDLNAKVADGYRLFSSGFSYDKVKGAIQDAKIEFTGKIHKTFSDIQNQLLAVPVATVIVATQMKEAVTFNGQFWINSGVLIGCWIFLILFLLLLCNQSRSLRVIGQEIDRQERKIAEDHKVVADMFQQDFQDLRHRLDWQKTTLWIVTAIVAIGWAAAHVVYAQLWQLRPGP